MSETIIAVYEGGVLRPLQPLKLPEKTRVQLRIVKPAGGADDSRVIRALLSTGRVKRLAAALDADGDETVERQSPPVLPGPSLSDILIAQRRGEL
jgi:predicted DNA-binding antitoxin AbrB/MazE fold protein